MAGNLNLASAQQTADRIRVLREELATDGEIQSVLELTADQQQRFREWAEAKLSALAAEFDVDTTASQERVSWGMRIASTIGALGICAALVLFFTRYWGYLEVWQQLAIVIPTPLVLLAGAEYTSRRERTGYFSGLLALVSLAAFILNLTVVGSIFNIVSTERALLVWGAFSMLLAYGYGLRVMLAAGILLLASWLEAAFTAQMGYHWLEFYTRPEELMLLGLLTFWIPEWIRHRRNGHFAPTYRLVGVLIFLISDMSLANWGAGSYLTWETKAIERFYEVVGLSFSAGAIWLGIRRNWKGVVNSGTVFFVIFLFMRLFHWWWDWMPRYLFFAAVGAMGIGLVLLFKRVRNRLIGAIA